MDKALTFIFDELKSFERELRDSVPPSDEGPSERNQDDASMQDPDDERATGITSFAADDCSFDFLARTLGVGFNWAFLSNDGEENRQLPWSLAENIDRS